MLAARGTTGHHSEYMGRVARRWATILLGLVVSAGACQSNVGPDCSTLGTAVTVEGDCLWNFSGSAFCRAEKDCAIDAPCCTHGTIYPLPGYEAPTCSLIAFFNDAAPREFTTPTGCAASSVDFNFVDGGPSGVPLWGDSGSVHFNEPDADAAADSD